MGVLEFLQQNNRLYLDGGMGTLLVERGLNAGEGSEEWNLSHGDVIEAIHAEYFAAGANAVTANTFGVNAYKYGEEAINELIFAAIGHAKRAAARFCDGKKRFVGLDIGPSGKMLKPFGELDFDDAVENFKTLVRVGVKAGADYIFIETFNDLAETKAAVLAAKEVCDLPVFVSNAYGEDGKLLSGSSPEAVAACLESLGVTAIGCNCSFGPKELMPVVKRLLKATDLPIIFKPNAGLPCEHCGKTVYDVTTEEFAREIKRAAGLGATVLGGCCGTTPEYIKALVSACEGVVSKRKKVKKETVVSSYAHAQKLGYKPVIVGERINPTGKKAFKEAVRNADYGYILEEAVNEVRFGAHLLDVNVGVPDTFEAEILKETVFRLQTVVDLPLCIDTSDPVALERAMRIYVGKPLVNSVNGSEKSIKTVLPLVKKYGGAVVCLTLDENGIPKTVRGRLAIAKKIVAAAGEYGIGREDLVFDALTMAVSAEPSAGEICLKTLAGLKKMGLKTILGVSNVSFGLPERDVVNAAFFTSALTLGLDAAIINPFSQEILKAYYSYLALSGKDLSCEAYTRFASTLQSVKSEAISPSSAKNEAVSTLKEAIIKGLKERAQAITKEVLKKTDGLSIINGEIMPALNEVGDGFEKKTVFLPQLLTSAECAKAAFDIIKKTLKKEGGDKKTKIVIATVKGDVHDIGKNIVRLLLENYGFTVYDLGKDVAPETVLKAVLDRGAELLGLSALMTTTVVNMKATIELVRKNAPSCKIMVGGAVLTEDFALSIGADYYAKDALSSVKIAERIENGNR